MGDSVTWLGRAFQFVLALTSNLTIRHHSSLVEIDRANKVESSTYTDTYDGAIGDAKLTFATAIADATLTWQNSEATSQQIFTTSSTSLDHTFSIAMIGLDQTYQTQVAMAEETRQYTRAAAEGTFFVAQTVANNTKRSATATAVISLTTASEIARVDAHTDIDNTLQLPWSQYLVDAATARLAWWNTASTQYAHLASDRNTAETIYTGRLATAHVSRQQLIATAKKSESIIDANSGAAQATAQADAVRDYFTNMVAPTKTYVDALATAERTKAVAIAQANRDYIDNESYSHRQDDIQTANDTFDSTKDAKAATYRSALAGEQADQYLDFATADFNRTIALVAADVSLVTTRNNAENGYRNEESTAYLQSATSWANTDAAYRQYEANSFASAASSLANNDPSPWAGYDAGFYNAQASQVTDISNAAKADAISQATAQKTAEIAQRNGETAWRNAYATADGLLKSSIAAAQKGWATAQSTAYAAAGGSDLALPTVYQLDELTGEYTVDGPGNNYRTTIYAASNSGYAHYYSNYWWGAWGYYGSGYWYNSYYGYGGYPNYGYNSSANSVYLSAPEDQFAATFWQINTDESLESVRGWTLAGDYGRPVSEGLVYTVGVANGSLRRSTPIDTRISDGTKYSAAEVIAYLDELGTSKGDLWTLVGSVELTPLATRLTSSLVDVATELSTGLVPATDSSQPTTISLDNFPTMILAQQRGSLASEAVATAASPVETSAEVALRQLTSNGGDGNSETSLTPEELEIAQQWGAAVLGRQMLLKAVSNSNSDIVEAVTTRYADEPDVQHAIIAALQQYRVVLADSNWSDYWIDHATQIIYISDLKYFQTRNAYSIAGELEGAIRDDQQFYQMFGLDESYEGLGSRWGLGLVETAGGGIAVVGGVTMFLAPEPVLTKAGGAIAVTTGANHVVAGVTSLWDRDSRVDVISNGLEKYYDATGADADLRGYGHAGMLMTDFAAGIASTGVKVASIKAFLTNSKAFAINSATGFQNLLKSGKSIRQIAKVDSIDDLVRQSKIVAKVDDVAPKSVVSHVTTSGARLVPNPNKTTTVIGAYGPDLKNIMGELGVPAQTGHLDHILHGLKGGNKGGFNFLNVSEDVYNAGVHRGGFFSKVNAAWVDDAVRRGDDILVVSARKHMFDSSGKLTGFGKEVDRLINVHGYRWNSGFTRLLPPG